ncbi:MAG: ATP-dependent Clp protease ATP-binding subunit [Parcubacteria group bacterium]
MFTPYFKDDYYKLSFFGRFVVKIIKTTAMTLLMVGSVVLLLSDSSDLRYAGAFLALVAAEKLIHLGRSRKSLKKLPKEGRINIADYVSPQTKTMFISAVDRAIFRGENLSPEITLAALSTKAATEAVKRLGVDPQELRAKIEEHLKSSDTHKEKPDVSDVAEVTLIRAFLSALKAGEESVMPADLLVAQVTDGDKEIKRAFNLFGIAPEDLEKALIFGRLAKERPVSQTSFFARRIPMTRIRNVNRAWTSRPTPVLDTFGYDITNLAIAGRSGFLVGHANEYDRLEDVLSRPVKPNVVLIGEPGVGKEAIIGHLAYRIVKDQVSPQLFDKRIVALDISALSSAADPAELQKRANAILNEIRMAGNVILYIPEIHNLARTSGEGRLSAANVLMSAINDGYFPTIGTTYPREYKEFIAEDSSFAGAFEPIQINEISEDEAEEYLSYDSVILEREWKVEISFAAIKKAVTIAKKYFHNKPLPSSAEELLKEALSEARRKGEKVLSEDDVIGMAEKKVNVPIHRAGKAEAGALLNLEEEIHERLIDQEEAVASVARALREYRSGLSRQGGPIASFLFVGPTGVGKTELAKALATIQFGSEDMMIRFDMSEYQGAESVERLIGGNDGKTYGSLTEAVSEKPYSLVLLDEFEKANGDVLNLFLQVLDDGRLTDGLGRTIGFENTIIIATSNAHSTFIKESLERGKDPRTLGEVLKKRLTEYFKPELLNRFSDIIAFKTLSVEDMEKIASLQLRSLSKTLEEVQGIIITFDEEAVKIIAREGYDQTFGARPLRAAISKLVKDPLSSRILLGEVKRGDTIGVSQSEGKITFSS